MIQFNSDISSLLFLWQYENILAMDLAIQVVSNDGRFHLLKLIIAELLIQYRSSLDNIIKLTPTIKFHYIDFSLYYKHQAQ